MNQRILLALTCLSAAAVAQPPVKYAVSPAGLEYIAGNSNNTYPFYGFSSSYQQLHDAIDLAALNGGQPMILSGMDFRPSATFNIPSRTFECEVTLGMTSTTAATASATFSANLGPNPKVVIPYTRFSTPAGAGTGGNPNAPLFNFPFANIFPYFAIPNNNLCWDWRQRNAGSNTSTPMDAVSGNAALGSVLVPPGFGTGCTATGRSSAAAANVALSGPNVTVGLSDGASSASAILAIGLTRSTFGVGWCTDLYTNPLVLLAGSTDSSGTWNAGTVPTTALTFAPYAEIYAQFAFTDAGLPAGLGLSDLGTVTSPSNGGKYVTRVFSIGSANGNETATSGTVGRNYGVVTMFRTL